MQIDPLAIGKALSDLGGWAAFLVLIVALGVALLRRWIVVGWMYDRTEARLEASETQAERNADTLASLTQAVEVMGRSIDRLERDYDRLSAARVKHDST